MTSNLIGENSLEGKDMRSSLLKRRIIFSFFVSAMLLCNISVAQETNSEKPTDVPSAQTYTKTASPLPVTITDPIKIEKEKVIEPDWMKLDCTKPQSHDAADLCEQKRMAQAAEDAVWWAALQTKLAIAGFFSVILTLAFTGWAAWTGGRAARSAQDAVALASNTAESQLRAYLSMTPKILGGFFEGGFVRIEFFPKNHGQTPAYNIHHQIGIDVFPNPLPKDFSFPDPEIDVRNEVTIYPDTDEQRVWADRGKRVTIDEVQNVAANSSLLYCWGTTQYLDIFGKSRNVKFIASVGGKNLVDSQEAYRRGSRTDLPDWKWVHGHGHGSET